MSRQVFASGVVVGGKVVLSHRTQFDDRVARAFQEGERVMLTVEKSTRNLRQNALYWVWVGRIVTEKGMDPDYVHHLNKTQFNMKTTVKPDEITGELVDVSFPGPTHNLSVDAFAEFMERVQRGWAEEGIDLPSPNDEEYS